jgi:hypothetical protein
MHAIGRWIVGRDAPLGLLAAAVGLTIGLVDSRPSWDDTGITMALLLLTSAMAAGVSGRRPWLWALLVGVWVPIFEIAGPAGLASLAALAVAAAGAFGGNALGRVSQPGV